jgi:hypothetical protein
MGTTHGGALVAAVALATACATANKAASDGANGRGSDASVEAPHGDAPRPGDAAGAMCATQPCSLVPQCGCGSGSACDINEQTGTGTACRAVATAGTESSTCAGPTNCAAGYVCIGDGTNDACEKYCASNSDCTGPRGQCVIQIVNGSGSAIAGAVVCSSDCDPTQVTNPLCPTGWTCDLFEAPYNGSTYDIVSCRAAGTAAQGATCSTTIACAPGYSCVTVGGSNECARICAPPSSTGCPSGMTCDAFQTAFTVAGTQYGVCL